jgi:uncharacterized protein YwqG
MDKRALEEKMISLAHKHGVPHLVNGLRYALKPSIRMKASPQQEDEIPLGSSKLGGMPDLPLAWRWPQIRGIHLPFIAQIRLSDVARYDIEGVLPRSGILSFFYDSEMHQWEHANRCWDVHYYAGDLGQLRRGPIPPDLLKRIWKRDRRTLASCVVEFSNELTAPPFDSLDTAQFDLDENYFDFLEAVEYFYNESLHPSIHRLLGHPDAIQNDMQLECQFMFENQVATYPPPEEVRKMARTWILLLQIDSDDHIKRDWGDNGRIYFWIRNDDLQRQNFERVRVILQCY